jgi:tRNA threonylcarbamoyladenosine modification (KEOPS) complex  Pcc1 subunit
LYPVSGCIRLEGLEERLRRALREALLSEAQNPPDPSRGSVEVRVEGDAVEICFHARDLSSARTLANAYLSLAAAVADSVVAAGEG